MKTTIRSGNGLLRKTFATIAGGGLVASALVAATSAQAADNAGLYEIVAAPTGSAMLDADPAPTPLPDPEGNVKELGPVNGSATKLGVIHTAEVPMLALTNPNAQVDLRDIWLGTSTDPSDGDQWLYFAWERDSANGSGVLLIEFQQNPLSAACDYDDASFDPDLCNPWAGRQAGDFFLVWDQQGQDITISKRTFSEQNGALALDAGVDLTSAKAAVSDDGFFGEAAVNLTDDVFGSAVGSCTTLANVIPGTVTGNSDTADYKDTVLAKAPPISNCGTVTVSKVTDPAGDTQTSFEWTLDRADGSDINYDPASSDTDTIKDGETDSVNNLIAADNYNLAEAPPGPTYALDSIVCTDASGNEYDANGENPNFPVVAGETTACVITNVLQPGTLTVNKVLDYQWGGEAGPESFKFDVSGPTSSSDNQFEADGSNDLTVDAGTYNVTETTIPDDYLLKSNTCVDVTVPAGGSASCTITNEDVPATLKVVKVIDNKAGGDKKFEDFAFSVSGPTASNGVSFESDGDNELQVAKGEYTVTEDDSLGYEVSYDPDNCAGLTIPYAGSATCTITNVYPKSATATTTTQSWVLRDSADVTMRTGGSASDITFTVFDTVAECEAYVADPNVEGWLWNSGPVTVNEGDGTGSANTHAVGNHGGYLTTSPGDYYWLAEFSGNTYNEKSNSGCGSEITVINATDNGELPE